MEWSAIRATIKGRFGSLTDADVERAIVARYHRAIHESGYSRAEIDLGTGDGGTHQFEVPDRVLDLRNIQGERRWVKGPLENVRDARVGAVSLPHAVYAEYHDEDGTAMVALHPPPKAGVRVSAMCVVEPPAPNYTSGRPIIPEAVQEPILIDGPMASLLMLEDERADSAQYHEQRYQDGIRALIRLTNSRMGSGPSMVRVLP
jgi:hypothetical protein